MSTPPEPKTSGEMLLATSRCDVCSVARDPSGVVIRFGEREPSTLDPRAMVVALRHRLVLGEGTARRLQDLMTALLNERTEPQDIAR